MCCRIPLTVVFALVLCTFPAARSAEDDAGKKRTRRVVLVGGRDSHGRGAHEFTAGSRLLARELKENVPGLEVVLHTGGWPDDDDAFAGADAIVLYMDGGSGHPVNRHLDQIGAAVERGAGLACLHYAVEVPKGKSGDRFLDWIGGYFETEWSVNPHWTAEFKAIPEHPITRGVKPFTINDEWYYNMRFRPDMKGVTTLLTAIPPDETRERPDGPHSNNPYVRSHKGQAEHVAWAYESAAGARGFGFTGGHFHRNWADTNFRTLVLNAILWIAKAEVPEGGTPSRAYTEEEAASFLPPEAPAEKKAEQKQNEETTSRGGQEPEATLASLQLAEGLTATLFASEPAIVSPTNLDVDSRGRVWVCEVVNYRGHSGKRPAGDRILILEDIDGDGRADTSKVFYQGRDIDSAMGICVLGSRVIVSASPNIFVFHDDDGDDEPDRKEVLFAKTGQPQHDHSAHTFIFGPDGKLYWNFGNTGSHVHDGEERPVVDLAGNQVADNGKPYYGGMVFRCNLDGSEFETLAHNFRNNYEVTVDSFGNLWQSDNDDDGNRGVRINFVMEFGNYGYRDEMTGAGWSSPRTGMHEEIPKRHWHLNDPGVVPNLLETGAGSPCGIALYEGELLPAIFRGQMIHCEPGQNVVRAYPVEVDGAGYRARIVDVMQGSDRWFRPADICVAPDGALFVTDWYDPGVGGHAMGDLERGRIYRIAPPGHQSYAPRFDLASAEGAVAALASPNLATRFLAWTALHALGREAETALLALWNGPDSRHRARALWLLGKIPGRGDHHVRVALADADPALRVTAIRLARQLGLDIVGLLEQALAQETSRQVLREWAIALRPLDGDRVARLWAALAARHDGKDRWYLEALGIGAAGKWDACLAAWLEQTREEWRTPAGRDLIWRSRASATAELLAAIITDPATPRAELPRYLRAFDFLKEESRQASLLKVGFAAYDDGDTAAFALSEAFRRLDAASAGEDPRFRERLEQALAGVRGTQRYVELVGRFALAEHYDDLVVLAREYCDGQLAADAIAVLLERGAAARLASALAGSDAESAARCARALATAADPRCVDMLAQVVLAAEAPIEVRREAVRALARTRKGAESVLELAREDRLEEALKFPASLALHRAVWHEVRDEAARLFPLPPARDEKPLPPLARLIDLDGDAARGAALFADAATCATCHVVRGAGKEVGPDLSEIGSKLSREALYESILYPDAGISHGYAAHSVVLSNGEVLSAIILSETPDALTVKGSDGIQRTIRTTELGSVRPLATSLMPADIHKNLSPQDLADVVAYLEGLRKTES